MRPCFFLNSSLIPTSHHLSSCAGATREDKSNPEKNWDRQRSIEFWIADPPPSPCSMDGWMDGWMDGVGAAAGLFHPFSALDLICFLWTEGEDHLPRSTNELRTVESRLTSRPAPNTEHRTEGVLDHRCHDYRSGTGHLIDSTPRCLVSLTSSSPCLGLLWPPAKQLDIAPRL